MMEARIFIYLGGLMLIHVGSADHGNDHTTPPAPERDVVLNTHLPSDAPKSSNTNPLPGESTTTHGHMNNATARPSGGNATKMEPTSASSNPQKATNLTDDTTWKPSVPTTLSTQTPNTTSHSHLNITHENPSAHEPFSASSTLSSNTTTIEPHPSTSSILALTTLGTSPTTTQQSTTTIPATSPSTTTTTTTSTTSQTTTTSVPSTQETRSKAPPLTTIALQTHTSMKTKLHPDTPSQLNVNGETVQVHESPRLDPLLAGLVSAFVVSAVVIVLLLFLKLRRRDNRPEFRRLQDLPMDDMMEETPLSMYSY
ncbi:uncharacterized protein LOC144079326 [Stigmatopora argus]